MFSSIKNSLKERKVNVQKTYPLGYIHIGTCQQTIQKVSLNKIQKFIEAKNNASVEEAEITPKKSKDQDHIDSLFDSFSNPK